MFGEGLELQRVERVLSASDVLHGVFPSAALAEETEEEEEEEETEGEDVHRQNESKKKRKKQRW